MKKVLRLCSLLLLVMFIFSALVACTDVKEKDTSEDVIEEVNTSKLSYISIRINPEIELVVDEEEKVVAVNAINEDGEIVLFELNLLDLTAEEAVELITSKAVELGFIDPETEEALVYILTECEIEEEEKELEEKLCDKVDKFFSDKGFLGKGCPEQLEKFKELAEELAVSLKDAKLISRILELYPEMELEEILELTKKELCELVKDNNKKHGIPAQLRDEYKEKVEEVKEEFSKYFELKKELKELEEKLEDTSLSEEELAAIQAEYDLKKAEYDTLKEQYKEKVEEVKDNHKEQIDKVKEEIKEQVHNRHEKHGEYKDLAEEWGVSVSEVKMIKFILELNPEMTVEELLELSIEELKEFFKCDSKKPNSSEDKENEDSKVEEDEKLEDDENPILPEEKDEQKEEIKDKFNEFYELKKQLKELKEKLGDASLSEEELAAIQAEYDVLKEQYEQYLEDAKEKHEEFKDTFNKWCDDQYKNGKGKK